MIDKRPSNYDLQKEGNHSEMTDLTQHHWESGWIWGTKCGQPSSLDLKKGTSGRHKDRMGYYWYLGGRAQEREVSHGGRNSFKQQTPVLGSSWRSNTTQYVGEKLAYV